MAFNPFHTFRKNSKVMMAALTIFVMIIFVLSSGGSGGHDFFDWLARMMGGADTRGAVLGSIEGKEFYAHDLQQTRWLRSGANLYLRLAAIKADTKMLAQVDKEKDVKDADARRLLQLCMLYLNPEIQDKRREVGNNARALFGALAPMLRNSPVQQDLLALLSLFDPYKELQQLQGDISAYLQTHKEAEKPTETRLLRTTSKLLTDNFRRMLNQDTYLLTINNKSQQDALEFLMYVDIADKMGIQLDDDSIDGLVQTETNGMLAQPDRREIIQIIRSDARYRDLADKQLTQAVGDEFRVSMVKRVVDGSLYSGQSSIPAAMTPYDLFEYYKDQRTVATWNVIDVSAERFFNKVMDEPTDREKREFFDKYRKVEFDPSRESPGLKEPTKVELQFIAVDGTSSVYKDAQPALQAASTIAGALTNSYLGGGPAAGMFDIAAAMLAEKWYFKERIDAVNKRKDEFNPNFSGFLKPRDSSIYQPVPDAALIAQLAILSNPVAGLASAVSAYDNWVNWIETRDRVRHGAQLWLAPFNPYGLLTGIGPALANLPDQPTAVYEHEIIDRLKNQTRPEDLARKDLDSFTKKLEDLRKKFEEKSVDERQPPKIDQKKMEAANVEARAYVQQWIKDHPKALTGKSAGLEDRFQIADDPALKEAFADWRDHPIGGADIGELIRFVFFQRFNPKAPADAGLYVPMPLSSGRGGQDFSKPVYVAWKTEDQEAKEYKTVNEIPAEKLLRAWKMNKARELAAKAADEVARDVGALAKTDLRDANNLPAFLSGIRDALKPFNVNSADPSAPSRVIDLGDIVKLAPLEQAEALQFSPEIRYERPRIKSKEIKFPLPGTAKSPGMAGQLVELRDKPLGETVVIPNVPKSHYYVCVLINKDVPNIEKFNREVLLSMTRPQSPFDQGHQFYRDRAFGEAQMRFYKDAQARLQAQTAFHESEELKKEAEKGSGSGD